MKKYAKYIPPLFHHAKENKQEYMDMSSEITRWQTKVFGNCAEKCFKVMETPIVTEEEQNCMTNCSAKMMEMMVHQRMMF